MGTWRWWFPALMVPLLLCAASIFVLRNGADPSEAQDAKSALEQFCIPPPRRYAGTVIEVSPTRLHLDEGKDRKGRDSSIMIGFICDPPECAKLAGIAKGDKIEAIFGAASVGGRRPFINKLLDVRVDEPKDRERDFMPAPCMGEAEVTAAALMREKDTTPWPKTGVFAGYYRQGFEISDFRPAGTKERWWLSGEQGQSGLPKLLQSWSCNTSAPCYIVVRGHLGGLGRHGHLGAYNRELEVTEIIEQRPLNSDEKVSF